MCSLHESKNKSTRPTHEILLSVWYVLMLTVNIYFDIFGKKLGIYSKKSRYFWSREAMCVSDYCHFVMLSENLLDFLEELYNIPTDLMFH